MVTEKRNKLDIYYQFDKYIKSKERKVSKATLTVYSNVKSHLLAFEEYRKKKITFESFDFGGKTIKHLRGFIKDRVKRTGKILV